MNWSKGFSAKYYYTVVDPTTWKDISRHELTGGSITRSDSNLLQSARIDLTDLPAEGEAWVRVYLEATQEADGIREPLFTGIMSVPAVEWDGDRKSYSAECYSALKPAADVLLSRGWYAAAGVIGAEAAAGLLAVGAAPVKCEENAPRLATSIVAEDGETNLTMAWKIVEAIGWRIRISGDGTIRILPAASEAAATFDSIGNDIVELSVTDTRDWFSCPNVFRAESGDMTAIARDDDEGSSLSTVRRGREIWAEERNCKLNDGESLAGYAARRLKALQSPARTISYSRRFLPDISVGDLVNLNYPKQNISAVFRISSQTIDLGYGARTSEEAVML